MNNRLTALILKLLQLLQLPQRDCPKYTGTMTTLQLNKGALKLNVILFLPLSVSTRGNGVFKMLPNKNSEWSSGRGQISNHLYIIL